MRKSTLPTASITRAFRCAHAPYFVVLLAVPLLAAPPEEIPGKRIPRQLPKQVSYPPELPDGKTFITATSEMFLEASPTQPLLVGVEVAKKPPTVDFLYYPGQTYAGNPWSNWGDSSFADGKYYSAIGDHLAPQGNAFVFEYDPAKKALRQVADVRKIIDLPAGHYTPGKIHSHAELGSDGWLYFSTHRGSTKVTTDANHYLGDWILRANPKTEEGEVVAHGPVPKHCIPNGLLDPQRLIFYGGTAPGVGGENEGIQFFAYDIKQQKVLYAGPDGPGRAMILAKSSGRIYYTPAVTNSPLMRFDPASGKPPEKIAGEIGIRAATDPTNHGLPVSSQANVKRARVISSYGFALPRSYKHAMVLSGSTARHE